MQNNFHFGVSYEQYWSFWVSFTAQNRVKGITPGTIKNVKIFT